jgi:hypothetical protein
MTMHGWRNHVPMEEELWRVGARDVAMESGGVRGSSSYSEVHASLNHASNHSREPVMVAL